MIKTFRPDETRPAGYVFTIPANARHLRDTKPSRPFLLLSRSTGDELASLALMTTKSTETDYGAKLYEFADQRGKQRLPGQERSYVNLSSFVFRLADRLRTSEKSHARHMATVRAELKADSGSALESVQVAPGRAFAATSSGSPRRSLTSTNSSTASC